MTLKVPLSQAEYLKKYLTGGDRSKKEKRKKKDKSGNRKGLSLVEDSSDIKNIPFGYVEEDDAPTIAEVTYEDEKSKRLDDFKMHSNKWKTIVGNDEDINANPSHSLWASRQENGEQPLSMIKRYEYDTSPPKPKRHDSDDSPPRRKRHNSDTSPPRRRRHNSDASPPRRKRHDSSSVSPPRRKRHDSDTSPPKQKRHDSDDSPPRKYRHDSDTSPPRRRRHDSDASPPRLKLYSDKSPSRRRRQSLDTSSSRKMRHNSDSSPPRKKREDSDSSPPRKNKNDFTARKSGKERRPEKNMTASEYLRARKFGKLKKETPEDLLRKEKEAELQKKAEEKYRKWNKGIIQTQKRKENLEDTVREMGKSFSRSADDKDMNDRLKDVMRAEDPMLHYIVKKKTTEDNQPKRPVYQGSFPPNRFKIRPGCRWDGVDRSSGFERDWLNKQSSKKAVNEESYKWSTEDM